MDVSTRSTPDVLKDVPATVVELLEKTQAEADDRRSVPREPFFRPVTVALIAGGESQQFSCFSRDISPRGIGLLHDRPLQNGIEVVLTIQSENLGSIRVRSQIMWCAPCGEGWYLSGARFLDVPL